MANGPSRWRLARRFGGFPAAEAIHIQCHECYPDAGVAAVAGEAVQLVDQTGACKGTDEARTLATPIIWTGTNRLRAPSYGALYDAVPDQRVRPRNLYVSDEDAREITEQLIRDAGFDPVRVGDLTRARDFEDAVWLLVASTPPDGLFYRFAVPGELWSDRGVARDGNNYRSVIDSSGADTCEVYYWYETAFSDVQVDA